MIERQLFRPKPVVTVLAAVPVSRKNIDPGKLDGTVTVFQLHQLQEPHHCRKFDRQGNPMDFSVVDLQDFDFSLPEKRDRFLPMHNPQGFIGRIEQEGHFHAGTSSPIGPPQQPGSVSAGLDYRLIVLCHKVALKSSKCPSDAADAANGGPMAR